MPWNYMHDIMGVASRRPHLHNDAPALRPVQWRNANELN